MLVVHRIHKEIDMLTIDMIKRKRCEEQLTLSYLNITDSDIPLICNFLMVHPEITHLDLCHNQITDVGAKILASIQNIQELIIHHNQISEEGIKVLHEQDPHKKANYGIPTGVNSGVPSLLNLSLFKAISSGLDVTKAPEECRSLKSCKIISVDPFTTLFYTDDEQEVRDRFYADRQLYVNMVYSMLELNHSKNYNLKKDTPAQVSTSRFFGSSRLGSASDSTATALDLESLRAHRIAYFDPK
ncbi:hypothetical protein SAMN02746073_2840 [Legionella jamestowniensis DSM 19215]|uniref:Gala protein type 1, 3 or 4 n=2 Tax=Legionella jamestowniensis TaxID=455 RepID=A0A0W0UK44_9GAMM|nr:Gala protein type 1, 3 or 4 [Legionella jamestowniensis]SFL97743.1 hypothetical protein SAMN02746073_2840 [Legionella jamestowniensis DSM 19215]